MKKQFIYLFVISLLVAVAPQAIATVGTAEATVKLYRAYLSANADCSSPVLFLDGEAEAAGYFEVDMAAAPTIGEGTIAEGTYQCVIFKLSDQVTFTPDATEDDCTAGTQVEMDVCRDYGEEGSAPTVVNATTGEETTCNSEDGVEDTIWVYVSTGSTTTGGDESGEHNAFEPPTDSEPANGFLLNDEIVISGNITGTFIFGTDDKVSSNFGECDMQAPDFGFSYSEAAE